MALTLGSQTVPAGTIVEGDVFEFADTLATMRYEVIAAEWTTTGRRRVTVYDDARRLLVMTLGSEQRVVKAVPPVTHGFHYAGQERGGVHFVQCFCGERFRAAFRSELHDADDRLAAHVAEKAVA